MARTVLPFHIGEVGEVNEGEKICIKQKTARRQSSNKSCSLTVFGRIRIQSKFFHPFTSAEGYATIHPTKGKKRRKIWLDT